MKILIQAPLVLALTFSLPLAMQASPKGSDSAAMINDAAVQKAQKKLQKKGFYQGEIDGVQGPATKSAVRAYQREKGLPETGALDAATLDKLNVKVKTAKTADADDGPVEDAARATEKGVRKAGEETGEGVRAAGKSTESTGEKVDNKVDKAGRAAGKGLEKGIEKTGDGLEAAVDGTSEGLKKAGNAVEDAFDKDKKASVEAKAKYDTRQTVDETRAVQSKLAGMGFYSGQIDGVMGPDTEVALRKYQEKNNLPVTGQLDARTRDKLDLKK